MRSGYDFVTIAYGEAGKLCEVGQRRDHLVRNLQESVRSGHEFEATGHKKQVGLNFVLEKFVLGYSDSNSHGFSVDECQHYQFILRFIPFQA